MLKTVVGGGGKDTLNVVNDDRYFILYCSTV